MMCDCGKPTRAYTGKYAGLCNGCRMRLYRNGTTERKRAEHGTGKIDAYGYRVFTFGRNGLYYEVKAHRLVMEKHLGRKLLPTEVVHHKDGNRLNNDINNLELFTSQSEHMKHHMRSDIKTLKKED
jgi:hypothetical protein